MRTHERIATQISPAILDTIGKSFKFRHGKGVAEWLKNSLDSYLRLSAAGQEERHGGWPVILHVMDGDKSIPGPNLAVIDFGGTTYENVKNFFLLWGDTSAATQGGKFKEVAVTGGHGNGGKFYMRQMWKNGARFCTWRDGQVTSLVVDREDSNTTGEWEAKNSPAPNWQQTLERALAPAEGLYGTEGVVAFLQSYHPWVIKELNNGKRGFTVVAGRRGEQLWSSNDVVSGKRWDHQKLVDEIRTAPQARRPIRELSIAVLVNGSCGLERLLPEEVAKDPDWPPRTYELAGATIDADVPIAGTLQVVKSQHQLVGKQRDQNVVSILDQEQNPIASYAMREIPNLVSPMSAFFAASLHLAFPGLKDLIENDREKLISSQKTTKILDWAGDCLCALAKEIEQVQREHANKEQLLFASTLNKALNAHAQRFLQEIQSEIMVNYVADPAGGGPGTEGSGAGHKGGAGSTGGSGGSGGSPGKGGTTATEGDSAKARTPKFPRVLLSGVDQDPAAPQGNSKALTKSHPPLWQDDSDRKYNLYWINTEHPFAKETMKRGGAEGRPFKTHQLYMFRDVVQREALRMLQRVEAEVAIDRIENELDEFSNRFLSELSFDLVDALLGKPSEPMPG